MNKRIIVGDDVIVLAGKDKGKIGKVINLYRKINKGLHRTYVLVSGINLYKKSVKSNDGFKYIEKGIDVSNVSFFDSESSEPAKIGYVLSDGKKKRCIKFSGKVIG